MDIDQLKSKYNESFERLVSVLKDLLKQIYKKEMTIEIDVLEESNLAVLISEEKFPRVYSRFLTIGDTNYRHILTLSEKDVVQLFAWMVDAEPDESLTDDHLEGLKEGANQIFGQLQAALEGEGIDFALEDLDVVKVESAEAALSDLPDENGLGVSCVMKMEEMSITVRHYVWASSKTEESTVSDEPEGESTIDDFVDDEAGILSAGSLGDDSFMGDDALDEVSEDELVGVHPVDFESFPSGGNGNGRPRNINMLLDVGLEAVVVLGEKRMLIRDILKLGKGSVVELDKAAGEPLEILINGKKLAEGEVVVVDDHFGIRITQLVGPKERIKSLG